MNAKEERVYTPDLDERRDVIPELGLKIALIAAEIGGRKQLADLLGVPVGTLGGWVRGETEPRAYYLRRLAHVGGTTADLLLCDRRDTLQEQLWTDLRHALSDDAATGDAPLPDAEVGRIVRGWFDFERRYRRGGER